MTTSAPKPLKIRKVICTLCFTDTIQEIAKEMICYAEDHPNACIERDGDEHYLVVYREETAEEFRNRLERLENFEKAKIDKDRKEYERLKKMFENN